MRKTTLLAMLLLYSFFIQAQVGINTVTPDPSALLEIKGSDGGLLIPRGTFNQRLNIPVTKPGLLFYDVTLDRMMITRTWNDTMLWMPIGPLWQENANALFIDNPFLKKIGLGTSTPEALLHVDGKSIFNDTMLVSGHLKASTIFVPGRTYTYQLDVDEKAIFNDTMLIGGFLKANGKTQWNDTMLVTGFLDANEIDVSGKAIFNDTIFVHQMEAEKMNISGTAIFNDTIFVSKLKSQELFVQGNGLINDTLFAGFQEVAGLNVSGVSIFNDTIFAKQIKISDDLIINGPTQWNDTMMLTSFLDAEEIEVQGKAIFNDTILAKDLLLATNVKVNGSAVFSSLDGDSPRPLYADADGKLLAWNDTMMVAFSALNFKSSHPINTQFSEDYITAGLTTETSNAAMFLPIEMPRNGLINDTLFVSFLDASPSNMTISLMEMKTDGSGMQAIESVTTSGNFPATIRTAKFGFDVSNENIDPTSVYLLRVTSPNWSAGPLRVLGGYLRLLGK